LFTATVDLASLTGVVGSDALTAEIVCERSITDSVLSQAPESSAIRSVSPFACLPEAIWQ
jgi:hypothetical protein